MNDNVRMEINIGGERIILTVPFARQDAVRDTERNLGALFETWRRRFPSKSTTELLAMVAYQYASFYGELLERVDEARRSVAEMSHKIDLLVAPPDIPGENAAV